MIRTTLVLSLLAAVAAAPLHAQARHYEGRLRFRGDDLLVRLALRDGAASLDLPSMRLAGMPLPASGDTVELPFGLGAFALRASGDSLVAERLLGSDTMRLLLGPGEPPPYRIGEVAFTSGDARIAASIYTPLSPGPHPGIVVVPACCEASRELREYASWGDELARLGYVALVYDKRGAGASSGSWRDDSAFAALADDVVAAAALLRARADVRAERIGLVGGSQAGWVIPLAAPRVQGLAFVVLTSPPAGTPAEVEIQSAVARMRRAGIPSGGIADAVAHLRLFFHVAHTRKAWPELQHSTDAGRNHEWSRFVPLPDSMAQMRWWMRHGEFDPAPHLARLDVPVLALFGAEDDVVPAALNADRLRAALGSDRVHVETFAGADHRLEIDPGRDAAGAWHWFGLAPGVHERIAEFLAAHSR